MVVSPCSFARKEVDREDSVRLYLGFFGEVSPDFNLKFPRARHRAIAFYLFCFGGDEKLGEIPLHSLAVKQTRGSRLENLIERMGVVTIDL